MQARYKNQATSIPVVNYYASDFLSSCILVLPREFKSGQ